MEYLKRYWQSALGIFLAVFVFTILLIAPPRNFPLGTHVVIASGTSVSAIAHDLAETGVVAHPSVLEFLVRISGSSTRVQAGTYVFATSQSALTVAYRLLTGDYGLTPVRITYPEGVTARDIAKRTTESLPLLSSIDIVTAGKPHEGYLFPDTYLFLPTADVETILSAMRKNFDAKIEPLLDDVRASGHSLTDIIIMASLVEKEVRTTENRKIVAGILWNRLERGIPLQVDAVFGYIFDRETYSPSFADLEVDSSYNTYRHKGLPPGPINNPGLDSIEAALYSTETDYLFYLTDREGGIHFATTYAEHQANERKYLN